MKILTLVTGLLVFPTTAAAEPNISIEESEYRNLIRMFYRHDFDAVAMRKSVRSFIRRYKSSTRVEVLKQYLSDSKIEAKKALPNLIGVWAWEATGRPAYAFNADGTCLFYTRGTSMLSFEKPSVDIPGLAGCWQDSEQIFVTSPSMYTGVRTVVNSKDEIEVTVHCQHFEDDVPLRLGPLEGLYQSEDQLLARVEWMGARPIEQLDQGSVLTKISKGDTTERTCKNLDDENKQKWLNAEQLW